MVPLINIHTAFEQMRILAHRALTANQPETPKSRPPRVLVLGPENSGKTSACKIWCNYAIRGRSWCPTLINLDVGDVGILNSHQEHYSLTPIGRLDNTWYNICLPAILGDSHVHACEPIWSNRYIGANSLVLIGVTSDGTLVRPYRTKTKSTASGKVDPQPCRQCQAKVSARSYM